ncbi:hypothetical protein [Dulcicalothrix desertica]|uniref:hypothetical protein n=1 Tax=Dulcicalothrix desertica TaxID=32056 RepID=UPI0016484C2D|nr:hypothetical protein [Dulcicalothrix desertica]
MRQRRTKNSAKPKERTSLENIKVEQNSFGASFATDVTDKLKYKANGKMER